MLARMRNGYRKKLVLFAAFAAVSTALFFALSPGDIRAIEYYVDSDTSVTRVQSAPVVWSREMRALPVALSILLLSACGLDTPTPEPDRGDQIRVPWVVFGVDSALELGAMTMGADCQRFAGVDVIESENGVEIQAWVEELVSDRCAMASRIALTSVTLDAPLGTRTLTGCMIGESGPYSTRVDCAQLVDP
jgi:hypothetical protein